MYLKIPLQKIKAKVYINEVFLDNLIVSRNDLKYLIYNHHKKKPYLRICYPSPFSDEPIITLFFDNIEARNLIMSSYRAGELYMLVMKELCCKLNQLVGGFENE